MVNSANRNQDELSPVESPAVVVMDIALRDRDFARLQTAQDSSHSGLDDRGWGDIIILESLITDEVFVEQ